ncbi:MAG: hypothetical protein NVSMB46_01740 [Candidatus Saccharimonadales bacterium]
MELDPRLCEQTFNNLRVTRHRYETAVDALKDCDIIGRLVTNIILKRAEKKYLTASQQFDEVWKDSPRPGDIIETMVVNHSAVLGIVQSDGSIAKCTIPTEPLLPRQAT